MKTQIQMQTDLFATPTRYAALSDAARQKALVLLQALLIEALVTTTSSICSPMGCKQEAGDE